MIKDIGVVVGLALLVLGIAKGEIRTWSDPTGKFTVEAEFVTLEGGLVTLRGATGKTKQIPLEELSAADQKLAAKLAAADKVRPTLEESIAALEKLGGIVDDNGAYVDLNRTQITDAGLAHIKGMTGLETLFLGGTTQITDAGLAHLEGMTELEGLVLTFNRITDAGLAHLTGLKYLTSLNLAGTKVTDAGVEI